MRINSSKNKKQKSAYIAKNAKKNPISINMKNIFIFITSIRRFLHEYNPCTFWHNDN